MPGQSYTLQMRIYLNDYWDDAEVLVTTFHWHLDPMLDSQVLVEMALAISGLSDNCCPTEARVPLKHGSSDFSNLLVLILCESCTS